MRPNNPHPRAPPSSHRCFSCSCSHRLSPAAARRPAAQRQSLPALEPLLSRRLVPCSASPQRPASPAPARRGLPSPLDSPPFPNADCPTAAPGHRRTRRQQLSSDDRHQPSPQPPQIYGWLDPSVNYRPRHSNAPEANDVYSNRLELEQAVLYIERLPRLSANPALRLGFT